MSILVRGPRFFRSWRIFSFGIATQPAEGSEAGPGKMQEYRATAASDPRPRVVVDFDNEIIKMILPPQPVAGLTGGYPDRLVIAAVRRILAPGVGGGDAPDRQHGGGPRMAVGAPPEPDRPERAARGGAIAFPLVRQDAAPPERDRPGQRAGAQHAAGADARGSAYIDGLQGSHHPPTPCISRVESIAAALALSLPNVLLRATAGTPGALPCPTCARS